jgi:hypothetical protein
MINLRKCVIYSALYVCSGINNGIALAEQPAADPSQIEMQQRLNEQVLSKPPNVADDASLTNSLNGATERGKPTKSATQTDYYKYYYDGYYYPYPYRGYYWR